LSFPHSSSPPSFPGIPAATKITASLRKDHDIIKKVLKATEICVTMLKEGKEMPSSILVDTIDFITNFIDRCHHTKEEHGLFPALEATGMPRENSAIGTMLREHEEARKIADQIKNAVESYLHNKNKESKSMLIQYCEEYVNHIDKHILKEDTRLFLIAERRLKGKENEVGNVVDSVEKENIGTEGRKQYEEKADRLFSSILQHGNTSGTSS
jgi:hemerythrin-like domain-containing protein